MMSPHHTLSLTPEARAQRTLTAVAQAWHCCSDVHSNRLCYKDFDNPMPLIISARGVPIVRQHDGRAVGTSSGLGGKGIL